MTEQPRLRAPAPAGERSAAIAEALLARVTSGALAVGARLPSEAELCAEFAVSRPTIREALGRVAARGLITTRRGAGGGSFVARPAAEALSAQLSDLITLASQLPGHSGDDLAQARFQLELGCAALAAETRAEIVDLREEIDRQSDFTITSDDFAASCQRFHLALCAAAGNPLLVSLAQGLVQADHLAEHTSDGAQDWPVRERARVLSWHVRIANAIAVGCGEDAALALGDLRDWSLERRNALPDDEPAPAVPRPPKMRDLRLPRVQRLGDSPLNGLGEP